MLKFIHTLIHTSVAGALRFLVKGLRRVVSLIAHGPTGERGKKRFHKVRFYAEARHEDGESSIDTLAAHCYEYLLNEKMSAGPRHSSMRTKTFSLLKKTDELISSRPLSM